MDLVIRNARLKGEEELLDIGVQGGKIAAIEKKISDKAKEEIDAKGRLTTPAFPNPHVHPDKSFLSDKVDPLRKTGGSVENLELTNVFKKNYTKEDLLERGGKVMELAARYGSTMVRAFADVDSIGGLLPLKTVLQLKEDYKDIVEIQVATFAVGTIVHHPENEDLMKEAMKLGPDLVGGLPWSELTDEDAKYHTDFIFDLARQYNTDIAFCDDTMEDFHSRGLEYTAAKVIKEKFPNIVTSSNVEAFTQYDAAHRAKVIRMVKEAGVNILNNPGVSLFNHAVSRWDTLANELLNAGVNVCLGQDDLNDPFYPFGKMDQLELAFLAAHYWRMIFPHQFEKIFDLITYNAAKAMGIKDYGLAIGCRADIVVHEAESVKEALRMRLERPYVIKGGRIVAENGVVRRYKPN